MFSRTVSRDYRLYRESPTIYVAPRLFWMNDLGKTEQSDTVPWRRIWDGKCPEGWARGHGALTQHREISFSKLHGNLACSQVHHRDPFPALRGRLRSLELPHRVAPTT